MALVLVLLLALTMVALPWPVGAQTNAEILEELRALREEVRSQRQQRLIEDLMAEEDLRDDLRADREAERLIERQRHEQREFQRRLRRGLPLPCCEPD